MTSRSQSRQGADRRPDPLYWLLQTGRCVAVESEASKRAAVQKQSNMVV
jgi:hypothetical protein